MTFPIAHRLRAGDQSDLPLILDAWVHCFRHAPSSRFVRGPEYFADQRALAIDLLQTASTLVACAADDREHVFGFMIHGPDAVIHFAFVKDAYRRLGLADELLDAAFPDRDPRDVLYATHASRLWGELEPTLSQDEYRRLRARGESPPAGALTRRRIFYRPHLLVAHLSRLGKAS